MAVSYLLGFSPKWVILDNLGIPAAGGKLYTYSNLNKSVLKATYSDSAGNNPYTNPIIFDANGTRGPIFFKSDSAAPTDTYYLRMYDADNNLLWDESNYTGAGTGGGGVVTNDVDIANLVTNGVFWKTDKPIGTAPGLPVSSVFSTTTNFILAPSAHDGFSAGANTNGPTGPDSLFAKNNTNATDTLQFVQFVANDLPTPEITPQYYLEYSCTAVGAGGETYKYVQFPITPKVRNLSNTAVSVVVYARCTAGNPNIQVSVRQFYGDGPSASAETFPFTPIGAPIALTSGWVKYNVTGTVPNVDAKTIGECGNDALFLCIGLPLSAVSTIDLVKPALYVGSFNPSTDFQTMDQIDAVTMSDRVGDIKSSLIPTAPFGYLAMNDGSIGSATSGATNRANSDVYPLYNLIWNGVSNTWAPVSTGRGASAQADFAANKTLTLPRSLGRALAGAGAGSGLTVRSLGEYLGTETISISDMPEHTHPGSTMPAVNTETTIGAGGTIYRTGGNTAVTIASQGGSAADGKMQPTSFFNVFIKY